MTPSAKLYELANLRKAVATHLDSLEEEPCREFMRLFDGKTVGESSVDEGTMLAWFANALMRGFDEQRWQLEKSGHLVTDADLRVLEAVKLVPDTWLEMAVGSSQITRGLAPLAAAELARRGEKP